MNPSLIRKRIVKWELMRLPFNAVCIFSAWFAWRTSNVFAVAIDEHPPAYITDAGALSSLLFGFVILNIAYSLVYAVEFMVLARASQTWSRIARLALFCTGCILGLVIAGRGVTSIADDISAHKWRQMYNTPQDIGQRKKELGPQPAATDAADAALSFRYLHMNTQDGFIEYDFRPDGILLVYYFDIGASITREMPVSDSDYFEPFFKVEHCLWQKKDGKIIITEGKKKTAFDFHDDGYTVRWAENVAQKATKLTAIEVLKKYTR